MNVNLRIKRHILLKKMKSMMKKVTALVLVLLVFATNITIVSAADKETDARMQEALTNRQYYVYKLRNIIADGTYRMGSTIVDEDYFDNKTREALKGVLGFKDIGMAIFGSEALETKYYRKVMAECVMPGMVPDSNGVDWALAGLTEEALYEKSKNHLEDRGLSKEEMEELGFVHDVAELGLTFAEDFSEAGELLEKACNYSAAHLNAIKLIAEYAEPKTAVSDSAKWLVEASDSAEFKNAFRNYLSLLCSEFMESGVDLAMGMVSCGATEYINAAFEILAGDEYESEMNELFYLNFQYEISNTFYKITNNYPNILEAHYTLEDIQDLTSLTLLFLRCGQLGYASCYPENANACAQMYRELQQMEFPWVETEGKLESSVSNVSVIDYNVPEVLSQGDYFVIFGKILSDEPINRVKVEAIGDNGYTIAEETNLNSYQFDIASLDSKTRFNDLTPGNYRYLVTVSTTSGEYVVISSEFQVLSENHEMTIVGYRLPHTMNVGDVFYVVGTVNSKTAMSSVSVEIRDMKGNYVTGGTAEGSYTSFDLSWLDKYVEFNKVPSGRYRYIVKATNAYGEEILVNQEYLVK